MNDIKNYINWIPVSERLPEDINSDTYLVQTKDGGIYTSNFGGVWGINEYDREVIAWQPLSRPCKEVKNKLENKKSTKKMIAYNDIRICPSCEGTVRSFYNYCCHCGQEFDKGNKKICSKCGTKYDAEYKYCLNCGYEENK